jgi:hypothetical protein
MLGNGDPAKVVYSFTLMERGDKVNYLRVQTDNYDQPLDINEQRQARPRFDGQAAHPGHLPRHRRPAAQALRPHDPKGTARGGASIRRTA